MKLHRPSSCKPTRRTNSYSRWQNLFSLIFLDFSYSIRFVSLDITYFRKFSNTTKQSLSQAKVTLKFFHFFSFQKCAMCHSIFIVSQCFQFINEPASLLSCLLLSSPLHGLLGNHLPGHLHLPVA